MSKVDLSHWLMKREAAQLLQVSEKSIERFADKGKIQKAMRKRPGLPSMAVYNPDDVERLKQARSEDGEPAAFVMREDNGGNGNGTAVAAVQPRFGPEVLMRMFGEAFQRQERVSQLFLTLKESSEYSGLPQTTLRQLMDDGKLEFMKTGAGYRIRKADLAKL